MQNPSPALLYHVRRNWTWTTRKSSGWSLAPKAHHGAQKEPMQSRCAWQPPSSKPHNTSDQAGPSSVAFSVEDSSCAALRSCRTQSTRVCLEIIVHIGHLLRFVAESGFRRGSMWSCCVQVWLGTGAPRERGSLRSRGRRTIIGWSAVPAMIGPWHARAQELCLRCTSFALCCKDRCWFSRPTACHN